MKNVLRLMMACVFALGIAACDDIIIPDHPGGGNGGNPGDSTGGGGGRDTTGGGNNDTTFGGQLVFTGDIVDMNGIPTYAPQGSHIAVLWETGRGEAYVLGQGEIRRMRNGDLYTVFISADAWPEEALFDPDGSGGVHGIARVVLAQTELEDHSVIQVNPNNFDFLGQIMEADIIFNTGREKATPWTIGWLDNFPLGLSLAQVAFNGWVPIHHDGPIPLVVTRP